MLSRLSSLPQDLSPRRSWFMGTGAASSSLVVCGLEPVDVDKPADAASGAVNPSGQRRRPALRMRPVPASTANTDPRANVSLRRIPAAALTIRTLFPPDLVLGPAPHPRPDPRRPAFIRLRRPALNQT